MFRVHEAFRLIAPSALEDPECGYFHVAQIVGNRPVWLVHALAPPMEDGVRLWRRIMVDHVSRALEFSELDDWYLKGIYVLLPSSLNHDGSLQLCRCEAIAECLEPDESEPCWRIQLKEFSFLDSAYGTSLGQEIGNRVVWRAAVE